MGVGGGLEGGEEVSVDLGRPESESVGVELGLEGGEPVGVELGRPDGESVGVELGLELGSIEMVGAELG